MNKNKALESGLLDIIKPNTDRTRKIPPLESWQPANRSFLDIVIDDQGNWWHDGTKMTRQSLVDLFASVLWVDGDEQGVKTHYLKTPSDLYQIQVVDTPLFICQVDLVHQDDLDWIEFTTTNADKIRLDGQHVPYFGFFGDEERLYVSVRFGLRARFLNTAFFHLLNLGLLERVEHPDGIKTALGLTSGNKTYKIISGLPAEDWMEV